MIKIMKKKLSKIRWVAVVVGIITVAVVSGCSGKATANDSSDLQVTGQNAEESSQSSTSAADNIYKGNTKLTFTFQKEGENSVVARNGGDEEGQYYVQYDENDRKAQYINNEGKVLLDVRDVRSDQFLGEGYFVVEREDTEGTTKYGIYKDNTSVYDFDMTESIVDFQRNYADGIIMYSDSAEKQVVLYDLNKKQEIARLDGETPLRQGNRMVEVQSPSSESDYRIIYDYKTGEPVSSTDPDLTRRAASCGVYMETVAGQYVAIFQEDGTKISELELKEDEVCALLLDCGCYVVMGDNPDDSIFENWQYHVYDRNSKWMCDLYIGNMYNFVLTNENEYAVLDGEDGTSCILFADGTVLNYDFRIEGTASVSSDIHYYAMGTNWTGEGDDKTIGQEDLISLLTRKTMVASKGEYDKEAYLWEEESKEGSYICLFRGVIDEYYYVDEIYDKDMNLIYGPEVLYPKRFLDDENILLGRGSVEDGNYELFILNLPTLKEYPLDVKGEYSSSNLEGVVTKDDDNYYIYQFIK